MQEYHKQEIFKSRTNWKEKKINQFLTHWKQLHQEVVFPFERKQKGFYLAGSPEITVGLNDLKDLFQPKWFYDSISSSTQALVYDSSQSLPPSSLFHTDPHLLTLQTQLYCSSYWSTPYFEHGKNMHKFLLQIKSRRYCPQTDAWETWMTITLHKIDSAL